VDERVRKKKARRYEIKRFISAQNGRKCLNVKRREELKGASCPIGWGEMFECKGGGSECEDRLAFTFGYPEVAH